MCCSTFQVGEGCVPGSLQGFLRQQLVIPLQGPGQDHLGAMVHRYLLSQSHLGVHLTMQVEDMNLRSCRLQGASVSQNLQVLVLILQQELCLGSGPLRIRRQNNASDGL